jgi:initiation factor 1A
MGKNLKGGHHKHQKKVTNDRRVRMSESADELYSIVIKMMGNGQCHIKGIDDVIRLCEIRGSFRGKNKSSNIVKIGSWVLVGLRTWESVQDKKLPKCDLLEIYSVHDRDVLLQTSNNFMVLLKQGNEMTNTTDEMDEIKFTDEPGDINFDEI